MEETRLCIIGVFILCNTILYNLLVQTAAIFHYKARVSKAFVQIKKIKNLDSNNFFYTYIYRSYRYSFFKDIDFYFNVYLPFYTNLSGYLVGIICGELYLKYTRTEGIRKIIHQPKYIITVYLLIPLSASISIYLGSQLELSDPSIWTALYAGVNRLGWNILVCAVALLSMSCNCGCK